VCENIGIRIVTDGISVESSHWLQELRFELQKKLEIPCTLETVKNPKDTQAADLASVIAIATLSVNSLSLLISIIQYYVIQRSSKPSNQITINDTNGNKINISTDKSVPIKIIQDFQNKKSKSTITIKIN
jgi:hypothetical protein